VAEQQAPAALAHLAGERVGDAGEVDDARGGGVQGGDAAAVRLHLGQPRGVQAPQPGHAVGAPSTLELVERAELARPGRDDDLAAALVGDPALLAQVLHEPRALDAQARLERPGGVVDARVQDAAVVAGLVAADLGLALEHRHAPARVAQDQLARDGQPDDARADDDDVGVGRAHPRSKRQRSSVRMTRRPSTP
jgi:hypothetical protein